MRANQAAVLERESRREVQSSSVVCPIQAALHRRLEGMAMGVHSVAVRDSASHLSPANGSASVLPRQKSSVLEPEGALTLYLHDIRQIRLLSRDEEKKLAMRARRGNAPARELLIKSNLRLVVKIAHQFDGMGVPLLDLVSEGNIGLMKAVDRYDPSKGAKLSVYASFWIKQHIRRALTNLARTIRIPAYAQDKFHAISASTARLQERLGRDPTNHEIAQESGLAPSCVRRMKSSSHAVISLDDPVREGEALSHADTVADQNCVHPEAAMDRAVAVEQLGRLLGDLTPRERTVLRRRFGLDGESEATLQQVSRELGLTRERVRQIQNAALRKLGSQLRHLYDAAISA